MRAFCSLVAALLFGVSAWASSIKTTTIEERTLLSDRVVRVEVLASETKVPDGDVRRMTTLTKVKVLEQYKGKSPNALEVFQIGGKSGLWEAHVPEDAQFETGEQAVLFLRCRDAANPDRCTIVGLKTGKLTLISATELLEPTPTSEPVKKSLSQVVAQVKRAGSSR
jgi:hypothetical protein